MLPKFRGPLLSATTTRQDPRILPTTLYIAAKESTGFITQLVWRDLTAGTSSAILYTESDPDGTTHTLESSTNLQCFVRTGRSEGGNNLRLCVASFCTPTPHRTHSLAPSLAASFRHVWIPVSYTAQLLAAILNHRCSLCACHCMPAATTIHCSATFCWPTLTIYWLLPSKINGLEKTSTTRSCRMLSIVQSGFQRYIATPRYFRPPCLEQPPADLADHREKQRHTMIRN